MKLSLSRGAYSKQALELAARVLEPKAKISVKASAKGLDVSLEPARPAVDAESLEGEFLNEALNQEYRLIVAGFNAPIAGIIATQVLFCARGPKRRAKARARVPKAEVDRLLADARAEQARSQPRPRP